MDVNVIVLIISVLLGGGGVISILRYGRGVKHDNIDYAKKIKDFYEERDTKLTDRIGKLEKKVEKLYREKEEDRLNVQRWSDHADKQQEIIHQERIKSNALDASNERLEKENKKLKKDLEKCKKKQGE